MSDQLNRKFTTIIEKEAVTVVALTLDQILMIIITCPHCKNQTPHEILYVGDWLNYHAICDECFEDSLLPNYDYDEIIDKLPNID